MALYSTPVPKVGGRIESAGTPIKPSRAKYLATGFNTIDTNEILTSMFHRE
jgi:hypothetical protein